MRVNEPRIPLIACLEFSSIIMWILLPKLPHLPLCLPLSLPHISRTASNESIFTQVSGILFSAVTVLSNLTHEKMF